MEKPIEICTFDLDVLLVGKDGQRLPSPMVTVAVDGETRVIIGVNISTGKPRSSNSITEVLKTQKR
ncbi:hypothetical protein D3C76_1790520 [compost metagenome]